MRWQMVRKESEEALPLENFLGKGGQPQVVIISLI